ncbi:MAG: BadM/Rrf2 family transcriptional regulator [Candidatus Dadabacteria bacterium CSP1-2]|nr:MAG: BadM/Rrf2 family transcriptional regulator [Candidatus Dadabacteria bacterium CSP1-2]
MQVSKTLDYAVRSLTYLSKEPVGRLSIKEISQNQHIPLNYLAKIMRKLVNKGIVQSMVGPEGGYVLRKSPREITLREVYEAIEGDFRMIDCMEKDSICILHENCAQLPVWDKLQISMVKILESTTLEDMLKQKREVM